MPQPASAGVRTIDLYTARPWSLSLQPLRPSPSVPSPLVPLSLLFCRRKTLSGVQNASKHAQKRAPKALLTRLREILYQLSPLIAKFSIHFLLKVRNSR